MSHQGSEGWFPECIVCGAGNVGAVVCLDPTCHESWEVKRISNDEPLTLTGDTALDSELVERDGHWWKLCKLCQRTLLSDPGAFGSFAICLGCFNTYMEAGILPPFTHDLVRAALDTGELRREQLRISVRKTKP